MPPVGFENLQFQGQRLNPRHISSVKRPSSGSTALAGLGYVACSFVTLRNLHQNYYRIDP
jgi:hypothetical protein